MGSAFPGSPRILKGALAVYPEQKRGTQPRVIVFQYNPENVKRTLVARAQPPDKSNAGGAREEALRVAGPPVETITLSIQISAADQLAEPDANPVTTEHGLHPTIAVLELLLYPSTKEKQKQQEQAQSGQVQIHPPELPLVVLVWGKARVVPVLITNFTVSEEAFDVSLNPIEVKLDLGLKVLTYMELKETSLGVDLFNAYQWQKEKLAEKYQSQDTGGQVRRLIPS